MILFELLIALTLVSLLSVYFIQNPMYQLKTEMDELINLEVDRLWLVQLMKWREELPKDWKEYPSEKGEWLSLALPVRIPSRDPQKPLIQRDVEIQYRRWQAQPKNGVKEGKHFRMRYERRKEENKKSKNDKNNEEDKKPPINPVYDLYFCAP